MFCAIVPGVYKPDDSGSGWKSDFTRGWRSDVKENIVDGTFSSCSSSLVFLRQPPLH